MKASGDSVESFTTGEALYSRGVFDSAQLVFDAALKDARTRHDARQEALALTWLGLAAYRLGNYETARKQGELALSIKLREGMQEDLFKSYNGLGLLAWNEGRLRDAVTLFEQAHAAADVTQSDLDRAKSANNMALVQLELGQFDAARRGFDEARDVGRRLSDPLVEGRALNNLGMLDIELGEARAAILALAEARRLYRTADDRTGEQNALGQLGSAYQQLGESGRALVMLDSALALAREQQLRQEEASNLELIAGVHRDAGDYERALRIYAQAAQIDVEVGLDMEQGTNLRRVAEIYSVMGRYDLARTNLLRALDVHHAAGAVRDELRDLLALAELTAYTDVRNSARYLSSASAIAQQLATHVARADVALTRARVADRAGNAEEVLRVLQSAESEVRGAENWQAAALRARAHTRLGQLDSAANAGRVAVAAVERLRGNFVSDQLRASFAADKASVYFDLIDILLQTDRIAEAFEIADQFRNRALLEQFDDRAGTPGSKAVLSRLDQQRRQLKTIAALSARLDALQEMPIKERNSGTQAQADVLGRSLNAARNAYETFLIHAATQSGDAVLLGAGRTATSTIQQKLQPYEVILEYLAEPTRLVTFIVRRDEVRSVATPIASGELARRVRLARDLVGKRATSGPEREILATLFQLLIEPVMKTGLVRPNDQLIIVPHSFLTYLPFSALIDAASRRYLIESHALMQLPSAAALSVLRSRNAPAFSIKRVQAFAPFDKTLPASVAEIQSVRRITRASITLGRRATEKRARRSLSATGPAHFATHGALNAQHPMFSRIEFVRGSGEPADDGHLEVHELLDMRVRAPLVFLSGCETAVGVAGSNTFWQGDDYATLAQAFLFAGASSVVATLWKVSDRASAQLAEKFYAHLKAEPPALAMAAAQREMISSQRFNHPYYWAAYQVSGVALGAQAHKPLAVSVSR